MLYMELVMEVEIFNLIDVFIGFSVMIIGIYIQGELK